MKINIRHLIDFEKVGSLLEGFNKSTGFVTAILDLQGNVLSKSGWRSICTEFHRVNPETSKKCTISDTTLGGKLAAGVNYHSYKCLNGLVDVAVPIVIRGEHIANLYSGQFFFEEPDSAFFKKQAEKYGFDEGKYLAALKNVPVVSEEKVKTTMDFLLNITQMIIGTFADFTEHKMAEMELARLFKSEKSALIEANKAKEQLSQILERITDGFGSLDRSWNYTFVNGKLAENVGMKREDLLGRNIWEVFPEAVDTPVHTAYLRAMEEQVPIDLEHYYSPMNRWFQHRFYPSPDGLSVFSKDITESKLAEEKNRENSSLIRIAAEKAKLGGWNVDLRENRSYWSDEVAVIHEMPPGYAPLVEDGIYFYAPEWRERIIQVVTDCAKNGVPYDEEMEIITSTGKRVWVRTIGEAVRDENGQIFKLQGAFQDISEKKMAEENNSEKDLQFRKLSANVPDLIFQFTRKTDGTYCVPVASEGIKNIFGCTPEDVVDDFTPIGNVIYPEDAERVVAEIEHSAKYLTQFTCEFRVQIAGRPIQWILSRSTPERLHDGSITWYGFNADITERKMAEENIRQLNEVLEQRVLDRTAQLDAANKELEAFSYSVSHDLRAPLRHINGYVDLLNERFRIELPEKAHYYLDTIADASKQMGTLIDDLLQFSRTGKQEVRKVGMDMNVLVKEVLEKIKSEIESRNITWKIQNLPMVYGDFALMNQVWLNLLDNAVKYTRNQQTAKISIGYKEEGKYYVFLVRDNGVGFDMKYAHKLFGVFQRLHSPTEFEGTGIGLANVQRIINKHGGRVWAEAEKGKGATFFFSLPKIGKEIK